VVQQSYARGGEEQIDWGEAQIDWYEAYADVAGERITLCQNRLCFQ